MKDLKIVVVGAGIGGLQTALALAADGHEVILLESAKAFEEVGAGIRVSPNSSRLSLDWGVDFSSIKKEISLGNRFVDWKGKRLLDCPFRDVESRYGAPYYFIHRADLIAALFRAAQNNKNITISMDTRVIEYDFDAPSVKSSRGDWVTGDLVICADGIKSSVRDTINGTPMEPIDTGDVAYRILVPAGPLLEDPSTRSLVTEPWAVHWMGPEGHAVGYPLRGGQLYNVIIDVTHRTDLGEPVGEDEWKRGADNAALIERFKDWCEPVRKLCSLTGSYLKWKLADFERLDRWVHHSGKVALLGDNSHPMMPYMAQGAAMATEDAGTLRAVLKEYGSIPEALKAYQAQRLPRTAYVAKNTRVLQEWLHLYDGPARDERDELMKHDNKNNPIFWGFSKRKDWLFGHDAQKLSGGRDNPIPELPPMPPPEACVYSNGESMQNVRSRI